MPLQPNTGFLIRFAKNVGVNFSIEKNLRKIFNQILKVFIPSASSGFGCWSSDCYPSGCLYSCLQSHQLLGHQLWPEAVEAVEAQCQRKRRYHWGHLWATWNQESLPIYIRKERPSNLYPVPLYKPLVRQKWYKYMVPKGYGRSFGCFTLQQPVHNTLRIQYEQHPYLASCQATKKSVFEHLPSSGWKPGIWHSWKD